MFYKGGMVISDQIVHLIIIHRYSTIVALILCHNKIRHYLGIFPKRGGGGPLFPKLDVKMSPKMWFFVKTKNVPYGLKCKINTKFFFVNRMSQKGGWGGVRPFGTNSQKMSFFFLQAPFLGPYWVPIYPSWFLLSVFWLYSREECKFLYKYG